MGFGVESEMITGSVPDPKTIDAITRRRWEAIAEFIRESYYSPRLRMLKINVPKLREDLRRRTGDKFFEGLNELAIKRWLEENGYVVIAYGSDGSNSSWILAIDPRDPVQLESVRRMCAGERLLGRVAMEVLRDPAGWVRAVSGDPSLTEEERRARLEVGRVVMEVLQPCLNEEGGRLEPCLARANLMMLLDGYVIASLVNMKVKVLRDPCTLVA